jgi:L-fucose isomerase-like protein
MRKICAGFIGFGEVNTPREVIEKLSSDAQSELQKMDWNIIAARPVSDDEEYHDADQAIKMLKGQDFDLLVICIAGWIPAHAVVRITDKFRHIPMLLWGLSGWMADGCLVTTAPQAGTSAMRAVMEGLGYRFRYVYSTIDSLVPVEKISSFGRAARAASLLREARIGSMGYRDMLLYGTSVDIMAMRREIGIEVECFEMLEIINNLDLVSEEDIQTALEYCLKNWQFEKQPDLEVLRRGAKYYLSLKMKIEKRKYDAVSLIDVDGMKKLEGFPPAMVFMLITDLLNLCTTPENDVIGNAAQLMVRYLTGQTAHYMEFYEYFSDRVLIGVPDYVPGAVTLDGIRLLPAKFGRFSPSLLNVSKVQDGPVTLLRLIENRGRYVMHMATGQAVQPRAWEEYGWEHPAPQLPSLEIILDEPVESFADKISSQHTILAYGNICDDMTQLCNLLNITLI